MNSKSIRRVLLLALSMVIAACGANEVAEPQVITEIVEKEVIKEVIVEVPSEPEVITEIVEKEVIVEVEKEVIVEALAETVPMMVETDLHRMSWDDVLAEADGQVVNWYHWGGSDVWNNFMDVYIAEQALACCNVTINPVHVSDTVEAVNKVLGEKEAGKDSDGSVDLIWINAENFITLRQPDLLFGPYADALPNVQYIDTDSGYYNFDAGWPIAGYESLWGTSQMVIEYDSAVVNPPTSIPEFLDYLCSDEARGLFTYPAPPDFIGTGFLSSIFYHYTGETDLWLGRPNQTSAAFDEKSAAVWDELNRIEECLWREGETYPADLAAQRDLVAQGEIAFSLNFGVGEIDNDIESGTYPTTMRQMMFDQGTVGNAHYMSIPYNAANKAGAMVIANLLQDPANQLALLRDVGSLPSVAYELLPEDAQVEFAAYEVSEARLPLDSFSPALPQLGDLQPKLEEAWRDNVLEQ